MVFFNLFLICFFIVIILSVITTDNKDLSFKVKIGIPVLGTSRPSGPSGM